MDKERIIKRVKAKLEEKRKTTGLLDWLDKKFNIKIPRSKAEAVEMLKNMRITVEDIKKTYKFIPHLKGAKIDKTSLSLSSLKKYAIILAALFIIGGNTLPSSASEAIQMCDAAGGCVLTEKEMNTFGQIFPEDGKKIKNMIEENDTIEDMNKKIYEEMKAGKFLEGVRKDIFKRVSPNDFRLYEEGKEIKSVQDLLKAKFIEVGSSKTLKY